MQDIVYMDKINLLSKYMVNDNIIWGIPITNSGTN